MFLLALNGVTSLDLKHFLCFRRLFAHFPSLPQACCLFNALLHQMSWWDGTLWPLTSSLPFPERQCFPCILSSSPWVTATSKDMALEPGSPKMHLWLHLPIQPLLHFVGNAFCRLLWRENPRNAAWQVQKHYRTALRQAASPCVCLLFL